ncbi:MAG: Na+/H+ antiporter NhaA [Bacteroidales bacterium]|nr:Na+/H+ antiporter NhaA [Bacteroidales bacterium]MDD2424607.1 Na+/H+ antiporter NhaA [Bacteroidales bacterium]MDD3988719.1 Na+/H+ antiporter NhaA [Bacteroidales bacterium]
MKRTFSRKRYNRQTGIENIFKVFVKGQSTGGIILLICTIVAVISANYEGLGFISEFWERNLSISLGERVIDMPLVDWINDFLMVIFFFMVGLEIKREMVAGELSSLKQSLLPIGAAMGGMAVPALLYTVFNYGTETQSGWGIPMATDIAFALGILSLLGKRVPVSIKVFLTALAIADDLGAIVVLAIFYPSHSINPEMVIYAAAIITLLFVMNRMQIYNSAIYIISGFALWLFILWSGIHPTIAGVLLAMTIPARTPVNELKFFVRNKYLLNKFRENSQNRIKVISSPRQQEIIFSMHSNLHNITPLINKFEHQLNPLVTFIIMPLFALANAGVKIDLHTITGSIPPISAGIAAGLLIGKPVGIFLSSWILCKLKLAALPEGVKWKQIFSVGIIAGIGFTMSIFIDNLAFENKLLVDTGKASILITSLAASVLGLVAVYITSGLNKQNKTN